MSTMTAEKIETLDACFGTYPHTQALKNGDIKSDRVALRLTEVNPVYKAFLMMAREQKFDVSEMALVTYLQAKAYGKPLTLMPATMMGRFQHGTMLYNSERGTVTPQSLPGRRIGVRSFAQTTGVWMRGILWNQRAEDNRSHAFFFQHVEQSLLRIAHQHRILRLMNQAGRSKSAQNL